MPSGAVRYGGGRARACARLARALLITATLVALGGCGDDEPAISALARSLREKGESVVVVLSEKADNLERLARESGFPTKEVVCFAGEHSKYDSSTGSVTLPTEADLENKVVGKVFPGSPGKRALNNLYVTLAALDSRELAKVVLDVGCSVG
jgi:hypothetical protein